MYPITLEIMLIKNKDKIFLSLMAYVNKVASLCATSFDRKASFRIHHSHHLISKLYLSVCLNLKSANNGNIHLYILHRHSCGTKSFSDGVHATKQEPRWHLGEKNLREKPVNDMDKRWLWSSPSSKMTYQDRNHSESVLIVTIIEIFEL